MISTRKRLRRGVAACAAVAGVLAAPSLAEAQTPGLPSVGADFDQSGPYRVASTSDSAHTFYFPANAGEGGVRHPVILWGNGTGTGVSAYRGLLDHYASHGFVVAAANTSSAMSGDEMLAGIDKVAQFDGQAGHALHGAVDLDRIGATGHSQGGFGAVNAGRDARVDTVFPLQGGGRAAGVESALFFAGGSDAIVAPSMVRSGYSGSSGVPAAYAELAGASHFVPVGNGGDFRGASTAWARMELAGDERAAALFRGPSCGLCTSSQWSYETNAAFDRGTAPSPAPAPEAPAPAPEAPGAESPAPPQPGSPGGGFDFGGFDFSSFGDLFSRWTSMLGWTGGSWLSSS